LLAPDTRSGGPFATIPGTTSAWRRSVRCSVAITLLSTTASSPTARDSQTAALPSTPIADRLPPNTPAPPARRRAGHTSVQGPPGSRDARSKGRPSSRSFPGTPPGLVPKAATPASRPGGLLFYLPPEHVWANHSLWVELSTGNRPLGTVPVQTSSCRLPGWHKSKQIDPLGSRCCSGCRRRLGRYRCWPFS
jgi:hypothetical protein